jgi:hypothetical protein
VNRIRHQHAGQRDGVFYAIVDDTGGGEYSLSKWTKVEAGPEQSGAGIRS